MRRRRMIGMAALAVVAALACGASIRSGGWSGEEVATMRSLSIAELEPLPGDPSNRYADDTAAAALGHALFFDKRLSANGQVSCASCHDPERQFQDGTPLAHGVGQTSRRTMPVAGTAYSPWQFWDGRKDSQWAQALGPLESPVEHGGTRALYAHVVAAHYRARYERIFGPLPELAGVPRKAGPIDDPAARAAWEALPAARRDSISRVYANIGKAIAAYERRLQPGATRFDRYVEGVGDDGRAPAGILSADEEAGLRLFMGRANCTQCHNGPRLTDDHFHNTGVPAAAGLPEDLGRANGARQVLGDEFNCTSRYSDARPEECAELRFLVPEGQALLRAYKTPSLRGVAGRAPYMHAGQIGTLGQVIDHYSRAPAAPSGKTELRPLRLSPRERAQIEAYLRTLDAPVNAPRWLLEPPPASG
ncbi:MAG TPA: cytochrome c peroxidase [Longimicrobium sp.]|nr:cytochrome c peroxidase [Longimicrobium sp.]